MSGESSVVMFRKSAVLKAGGYKHFPLFEDYYLVGTDVDGWCSIL